MKVVEQRRRDRSLAALALALAACHDPAPRPGAAPPGLRPSAVELTEIAVPPPSAPQPAALSSADPSPGEPSAASSDSAPSPRLEKRCGWVDNPTPANWSITDRDGEWVIGVQGGYQAEGDMPDFGSDWVEQNGHYGYGCACVEGRFDPATRNVLQIKTATKLSIARCLADKRLPRR